MNKKDIFLGIVAVFVSLSLMIVIAQAMPTESTETVGGVEVYVDYDGNVYITHDPDVGAGTLHVDTVNWDGVTISMRIQADTPLRIAVETVTNAYYVTESGHVYTWDGTVKHL